MAICSCARTMTIEGNQGAPVTSVRSQRLEEQWVPVALSCNPFLMLQPVLVRPCVGRHHVPARSGHLALHFGGLIRSNQGRLRTAILTWPPRRP